MEKQQGRYATNKRLKQCTSCGGTIAKNARTCPHCGAKNKKPVYKRLWFLLLVVLVIVLILGRLKNKPETNYAEKEAFSANTIDKNGITEESLFAPTIEATIEPKTEHEQETVISIESEETAETEVKEFSTENVIRPEFKSAMDEYEKFFDEYCEIMKKASNSPNDISIMMEYSTYMAQYVETMEKFEALGNEELTTAETIYYIEVNSRITQKLMEVSTE